MTAMAQIRQELQTKERQSALLVILVAFVALGIGWGVKTAVSNQTRPFTSQGVSAEIPSGWLVQEGTGELVMVARNPADMDHRYRIQLLAGGADISALANQHSENRARLEPTFKVLEDTAILADGRDGYKVTYAWVNSPVGQMPAIIEGVDYYFPVDNRILVISLEADHIEFAAAFSRFQTFRASVAYEAGG